MRRYLLNVAIAVDQLINTILRGRPDETISSRVGRNAMEGDRWALIAEKVINFIFDRLGDYNHCRNRIEWDEIKRA